MYMFLRKILRENPHSVVPYKKINPGVLSLVIMSFLGLVNFELLQFITDKHHWSGLLLSVTATTDPML
jgi:hypothetical protein